eukprot:4804278-Lingulodinium_polyedra.AAC.1
MSETANDANSQMPWPDDVCFDSPDPEFFSQGDYALTDASQGSEDARAPQDGAASAGGTTRREACEAHGEETSAERADERRAKGQKEQQKDHCASTDSLDSCRAA